jgi:Periplasmic protease
MKRKILDKLVFCLLILCLVQSLSAQKISTAPGQPPPAEASARPSDDSKNSPERARRMETFRMVWQQINDNYFDQTFGGLNWNSIRAEFEPRAEKAETDAELHMILQEMINRLNKSHFMIIPPEVYREFDRARAEIEKQIDENWNAEDEDEEEDSDDEQNDGETSERTTHYGIGIDIRILNGQIVITSIEPDSPASKAGLKTGYVIEKINNVSLRSFLEMLQKNQVYAKVYEKQTAALLLSLINTVDDKGAVLLSVIDENDRQRQFEIPRVLQKGEVVSIITNLPPVLLTFETRHLSDDIGYIAFNAFALGTVEKFCSAISEFKNKKAIIIDVRGNLGGNLGALFGISSLLTDKGFIIGTEIKKTGREPRFIQPQIKNFKGKLAILTDSQSYSAAEMFASGLQENKRAVVVGDRTSGSALPSMTQVLPTGAVFLFPVANFQTPNGNFLEGRGVLPDIKVSLDRKSLLAGKDAQLQAAVEYLNAEIKKNPPPVKEAGKLADVKVKVPAPKIRIGFPMGTEKPVQQETALRIIDDFIEVSGGSETLSKLKSFSASGFAEIKQTGTVIEADYELYRTDAGKFAKITKIAGVGEINEIFDGKNYFVQTNFMGNQKPSEFLVEEVALMANMKEILQMREIYPTITFEGVFEREGRKVNVVKAITKRGDYVFFAFDTETKFLVSRVGRIIEMSFDDYRKVGEWMFPFTITEGVITYRLKEIKPNAAIDESRFVQKENCFSKID